MKSPLITAAFGLMQVTELASGALVCDPLRDTEKTPRSGFVIAPELAARPLHVVFGEWIVLKSGRSYVSAYPLRTLVRPSPVTSQAIPARGPKLFLSMSYRRSRPEPSLTSPCPVMKFDARLFTSFNGRLMS